MAETKGGEDYWMEWDCGEDREEMCFNDQESEISWKGGEGGEVAGFMFLALVQGIYVELRGAQVRGR